jgi:hypothetical protein
VSVSAHNASWQLNRLGGRFGLVMRFTSVSSRKNTNMLIVTGGISRRRTYIHSLPGTRSIPSHVVWVSRILGPLYLRVIHVNIKSALTPLAGSGLLDDASIERLRKLSITTVEELVGVLESDINAVADLLDKGEPELRLILDRAMGMLDERHRTEFKAQKGISYPLGAFPPSSHRRLDTVGVE